MSTHIEWTDETWNPVVGCSIVSPGCHHCYAARMAKRLRAMAEAKLDAGRDAARMAHYIDAVDPAGRWTGKLNAVPESLSDPFNWKTPRMVFVNSMSDLFHEEIAFEFIAAVFGAMAFTPEHTFQVLTKRPKNAVGFFGWVERMAAVHSTVPLQVCLHYLQRFSADPRFRDLKRVSDRWEWPMKNLLLGVSVEDQKRADERIPLVLQCPATVRFLSMEPLLGPVEFSDVTKRADARSQLGKRALNGIHWVIVGGESGHDARPMHPDWARSLRDQCRSIEVPFFFKQWGEWCPFSQLPRSTLDSVDLDRLPMRSVGGHSYHRVGKKQAGRELDGRTWHEFPTMEATPCAT